MSRHFLNFLATFAATTTGLHAMRLLKLLLLLFVCAAAAPAVAGPYEDAEAAFEKGDYATTVRLMQPLADQGRAPAQRNLGFMYDEGKGVPQDYAAAVMWYRKAADKGDAIAQNYLGLRVSSLRGEYYF